MARLLARTDPMPATPTVLIKLRRDTCSSFIIDFLFWSAGSRRERVPPGSRFIFRRHADRSQPADGTFVLANPATNAKVRVNHPVFAGAPRGPHARRPPVI